MAGGGFDQALDNLRDLREWLGLAEKGVGATTSRFIFDFSRAVSSQNYDSRLRIVSPDHPDDIKAVMTVGHGEAQILNDDFIAGGAE